MVIGETTHKAMTQQASMPDTYVLIYSVIDDILKLNGHAEPANTKLSDSEVAFLFIAACLDYGGNVSKAQDRLHGFGAIRDKLHKGQLNRRLHDLRDPIVQVYQVLAELKKKQPINPAIPPTQLLSQCAKTFASHVPKS
jgi:hypothetical protein